MRSKKSFTLIEILVVATIVGILTTIATITYSQISKQSRDAKRKADLDQIRAALEMYYSNNNSYPSSLTFNCASTNQGISANGITYLQSLPNDPKCNPTTNSPNYSYTYISPNNYVLTTTLEINNYPYNVGPYGETTVIPSPTQAPAAPSPSIFPDNCFGICTANCPSNCIVPGYCSFGLRCCQTSCSFTSPTPTPNFNNCSGICTANCPSNCIVPGYCSFGLRCCQSSCSFTSPTPKISG